jgi:hypothetical protein
MAIKFWRASDLYNVPARKAEPAQNGNPPRPARAATRGLFNVGKSAFYEEIEPRLEKAQLGERAVGYTDRSVEAVQAEMIAQARAKRGAEAA